MALSTIKNEIYMTTILSINNLSISFGQIDCFKDFTTNVQKYRRIGLIGPNGSGKSSLLNVLANSTEEISGYIKFSQDLTRHMIHQLTSSPQLSGGEAFRMHLEKALQISADLLLLDEPTNHLDQVTWQNLVNTLLNYPGTIIFASHDELFLSKVADQIWAIEFNKVRVFDCHYNDFCELKRHETQQREAEQLSLLKKQRKLKKDIAFEQKRAEGSRRANMHENDRKLLQAYIQKGQKTIAKNNKRLNQKKGQLEDIKREIKIVETRNLQFHQLAESSTKLRDIVHISEGSCGYLENAILSDIFLNIGQNEKIAITGNNGSGKSTLFKALLKSSNIWVKGHWHQPKQNDIGYLDQFYSVIQTHVSVFDHIKNCSPNWDDRYIRKYLNDYGFSKNSQVENLGENLSGGERARLCMALLSSNTPKLLLLDEITNNLDIDTKDMIVDFLNDYRGSYIIICHDLAFLKKLHLDNTYITENQTILNNC